MNLCEHCLEQDRTTDGLWRVEADAYLCDGCADSRNEAAYERSLDAYYGGSGPQTDRERMAASYDAKKAGTR